MGINKFLKIIYTRGTILWLTLYIVIVYTRCQHQSLSSHMFCRAVLEAEQGNKFIINWNYITFVFLKFQLITAVCYLLSTCQNRSLLYFSYWLSVYNCLMCCGFSAICFRKAHCSISLTCSGFNFLLLAALVFLGPRCFAINVAVLRWFFDSYFF